MPPATPPSLPLSVRHVAQQFDRRARRDDAQFLYGEIARRIGAPGSALAVGRACATNQAAGVIPCHRAVGSNGALTGYRWGVARKERLLAAERLEEGRRRSNT